MTQLKAFIVEDSPVIRENLVAALEEMAPIRVVGNAEDEASAVGWLKRHENHCDLVVVDIFLKSGSGLGVLKAAAKLPAPTKLVVLSNYATPDMRRKCLELGADRVFDKSNEIDALILYCCRLADGGTSTASSNRCLSRWAACRRRPTGSARSSGRSRSGRCWTRASSSPSPASGRCSPS
jgi:DNA-binding NarL/FixJ family response regulator